MGFFRALNEFGTINAVLINVLIIFLLVIVLAPALNPMCAGVFLST